MKVYCILSDERAFRSRSPTIFSTVMEKVGVRAVYAPLKVYPENIGPAVQSLRVLNFDGANVTVPYKEAVVPHLDILSEGANIIGAVNTIVRNGDILKGYNTNAIGIMDALAESGFKAEGKSALVFGTGGAAKAAVFILNWLRTRTIFVTGRDKLKTREIVGRFGGEDLALSDLPDTRLPVHIIVNATSVSTPEESSELAALVAKLNIPDCELLLDLNYGRIDNFWQHLAQDRSIHFMDGLAPLAFQARRTLALWTGLQVPPEEFLKALDISS